jgi:hypothetical protein
MSHTLPSTPMADHDDCSIPFGNLKVIVKKPRKGSVAGNSFHIRMQQIADCSVFSTLHHVGHSPS